MTHLNEEQLILYYYAEGGDRPAVEEHLASCAACRSQYQGLQGTLDAVEGAPAPERSPDYGSAVWGRLRPRLGVERRQRWRRWAAIGAVAAMVTLAFLAGRFWQPPPQERASLSTLARQRLLLADVGDHLERAQMVLTEVANTPAAGRVDISAEQQWVQDLLSSNRLYRQTAAGSGQLAVAVVLDELERVLLEIAHSPSRLSPRELEDIHRRVDGILFQVRSLSSQVRRDQL